MRVYIVFFLGFFFSTLSWAADFQLTSPGYKNDDRIPVLYTCDGKNVSPALNWSNAPLGTKSFVILFTQPDSAIGGTFYNWVVYNIPSTTTSLSVGADDLPEDALVGLNSFGDPMYTGPCPPDRASHHYIFTLYALDKVLDLPEKSDAEDVLTDMKHHILKNTQLNSVFSH